MRLLHVALLTLLVPVAAGLAQTGFQSPAPLVSATVGFAQPGFQAPAFAPFPETTIDGVVEHIDDGGSGACEACQACVECAGTHLVLRKGSARVDVHLAPAWFLDRSGFAFAPGDLVSVTGTRITIQRERGILAREVRRGRELMRFRDEHGLPLWRRELTDLDRAPNGADERRGR